MRRDTRVLLTVSMAAATVIGAWQYRRAMQTDRVDTDAPTLTVGEPVRFKNLTIFPVFSSVAREQDRFITLDEGLKSGLVRVEEVGGQGAPADDGPLAPQLATEEGAPDETADDPFGDQEAANGTASDNLAADDLPDVQVAFGPDVNHLLVTNDSDRPLYLMPGEVLFGGQQDRSVADEFVVAPHTQRMPIEVFCVEHGRWSLRSHDENAQLAGQLAGDASCEFPVASLVVPIDRGEFAPAGGSLNKAARLTVHAGKGQQAVWDTISETNVHTAAESDSGAFTANYADPRVADKLKPYVTTLEEQVAGRPRVVGVIVAINGRLQAADTFESTPLFRKLWPKLLKSYVLDATMPREADAPAAKDCSLADAQRFLRDAMQARVAEAQDRDGLVTTRGENEQLESFAFHDRRGEPQDDDDAEPLLGGPRGQARGAPAMGMGGMGGGMGGSFGGGVHSAAFAK